MAPVASSMEPAKTPGTVDWALEPPDPDEKLRTPPVLPPPMTLSKTYGAVVMRPFSPLPVVMALSAVVAGPHHSSKLPETPNGAPNASTLRFSPTVVWRVSVASSKTVLSPR